IALPDSPTSSATFMGPMLVTFGVPLSVGSDAALTAAHFGPRFLPFYAGTLKLTGNMSTARTVSLIADATIDTNAHDLTLTGGITGGIATLTKTGDGTLTIATGTTSANTAKTFVNRGVYMLNGTQD